MPRGVKFSCKVISTLLCMLVCIMVLAACAAGDETLKDGYYTAEVADYDYYGWKDYLTICVLGGEIVSVQYDAENASGLERTWDMDYMRQMNLVKNGVYPSQYGRYYSVMLLQRQSAGRIDVVAGATYSHQVFQLLAQGAINGAQSGDNAIVYVEISDEMQALLASEASDEGE